MKNKKQKGICIVVAGVILWPLLYVLFGITYVVLFHINQYDAAFLKYKEEFCVVKDYVWQQFPDRLTEEYQSADVYPWLSVTRDENGRSRLYDHDTKEYLQIPEEVAQALNRIDTTDAFPAYLDLIRFEEGQLQFCGSSDQGWYALIYSPNGRPKTFRSHAPEEVCIKWIGGGRYHATRLEDWMVISKWFS